MLILENMIASSVKPETRLGLVETALNSMSTAVLLTDENGVIQSVNRRGVELLALPQDKLLGHHIDEILGLWDARQACAFGMALEQVMQFGLSFNAKELVMMRDVEGEGQHLLGGIDPLRDADHDVIGMVLTFNSVAGGRREMASREKAPESVSPAKANSLYVRSNGRYIRVKFEELLWVEAMENYVQLQTTHDKIVVHATLKSMVDALSDRGYQRIHRSFIVKKSEIERIEENQVIVNGTALPIGKSYRNDLLDSLTLI